MNEKPPVATGTSIETANELTAEELAIAERLRIPTGLRSLFKSWLNGRSIEGLEKEWEALEEEERLKAWKANHSDEVIPPELRRECGPFIAQFEEMLVAFEAAHSLVALHAITELSVADAPKHPIRQPAKEALVPIYSVLKKLDAETNISRDKFEELKAKYKEIGKAVGIINAAKGTVDHTRS